VLKIKARLVRVANGRKTLELILTMGGQCKAPPSVIRMDAFCQPTSSGCENLPNRTVWNAYGRGPLEAG
jgi:hypothetical protein